MPFLDFINSWYYNCANNLKLSTVAVLEGSFPIPAASSSLVYTNASQRQTQVVAFRLGPQSTAPQPSFAYLSSEDSVLPASLQVMLNFYCDAPAVPPQDPCGSFLTRSHTLAHRHARLICKTKGEDGQRKKAELLVCCDWFLHHSGS